jgi:hypothetical protein
MLRTTSATPLLALLALLAGGLAPLAAQEPPPVVPVAAVPPATQEPPVAVQDPPPSTRPPVEADLVLKPEQAPRPVDPLRRREQVLAMEGLLTSAVKSAATAVWRQMQAVEPGLQLFTGVARANGFYLDDYGVFFHVEIPPGVSPSVAWLIENMERERSAFERAQPTRMANRPSVPFDPNQAYVMAVQQKLMDAMLDYRIDLHPHEWVGVAAREAEGPIPGQIVDSPVMMLRLRASDLADYYAGRITREEIRHRVEVRREF